MPFLTSIGFAPAATLRSPSRTIAQASTVAVVVPSPATSSVFFATSLTSEAPICSYGSSSSISLAIDTPSFVIVGAPHFLVEDDVAALRPERDPHRIGELVHPGLEPPSGIGIERDLLRHVTVLRRRCSCSWAPVSASTLQPRLLTPNQRPDGAEPRRTTFSPQPLSPLSPDRMGRAQGAGGRR